LSSDDYTSSLNLLSNQDEFKYNVITVPGLTQASGSTAISLLLTNTQNRGDAIAVIDLVDKDVTTINAVVREATEIDNSYASTYWPWVQVNAPNTGKLTWVPTSTIIPGVYAYNDRVSAPWFAPGGFTRGGLSVVQAAKKLSPTDRDTLYAKKVNPIATFPGQGVVAYGQKTLQQKASALDRINVRRLLIELKSYIGQVANTLVFEQNTFATRNKFLSQVNPYLDSIQQRQGLYAFKVVMDDTNNTADVIDRNQLVGQIFIQPTRTAEFIVLDFNVSPTGASF
jgi:phage tail sheath protein FI